MNTNLLFVDSTGQGVVPQANIVGIRTFIPEVGDFVFNPTTNKTYKVISRTFYYTAAPSLNVIFVCQ